MASESGDEREQWRDEAEQAERRTAELESQLETLMLPRDPNDGRNVIVEIRGAEGGEEANLFAGDLAEMYRRYAAARGWKLEVIEQRDSDQGGIDEAIFRIKGDDAWTRMEFEAGVHRVQRVPVTEAKGRVHTSSATVSVLPEAEEVDIEIDPNDLNIDVYRSSGPGGQSVNTTDSAVRITHIPTGIVVSMQDEKSQIQNRQKAMFVLRSRLLKAAQDAQALEHGDLKRSQLGGGGRSEKIRTYNFKENRVTDHRIGLTLYTLESTLAGELDPFVDALLIDKRQRQLREHAER
jgi:peptide chain release factor 1